jgi:hypothetical protein
MEVVFVFVESCQVCIGSLFMTPPALVLVDKTPTVRTLSYMMLLPAPANRAGS